MKRFDGPRVAITGMGLASPIGHDLETVATALRQMRSGIRAMPEWNDVPGLVTRVAGVVDDLDLTALIPRKFRRSMGKVAALATYAAERALADSGIDAETVRGGRLGIAAGSTTGSAKGIYDGIVNMLGPDGYRANKSTAFLKTMSHTCAANVALALGITGRVWSPNSACTSGSQSIGLGFDTVRAGAQDVMVCGGAEEVHFTTAATFELVGAASARYNDRPKETPRPFDRDRDGLVVGEGAGMLVLERWDHAVARKARIYGEILGFATKCDGEHITSPAAASMAACMRLALDSADVSPADVDYINAHATGTDIGDPAEAQATREIFGDRVPISSTKGYVGHTLGACGAIESIFVLLMLGRGFVAPTLNLHVVDESCAGLWHVTEELTRQSRLVMNNNFAFGGINTSLLFGAPS